MSRTIERDLIVQISGPGWNYGLARLLIDSDGNGAVFIPPGDAPVQTFTATASPSRLAANGTSDDGAVTWRRRGSSCSFALAKCQVSSLADRWV